MGPFYFNSQTIDWSLHDGRKEFKMAKCPRCKNEMLDPNTTTCTGNKVVKFPDGTKMAPVPYTPDDPELRCHDCNVASGGLHHLNCDMEICPRCGGQFFGCSCFIPEDEMSEKKEVKKVILTSGHNYWRGFAIRLYSQLDRSDKGCYGDLRFSTKILKSHPGIDVEGTLNLFKEMGGICDCRVLSDVTGIEILEN